MWKIYVVGFLFFCSCSQLDREKIKDKYYVTKVDHVDDALDLSFMLDNGNFVGVIEPKVVSIGYDEDFIIVARVNSGGDRREYYIIELEPSVVRFPDENKLGPFSLEEFNSKRVELGLSEKLDFSLYWD
ncbi:8-oxoguanine DNA glycosylase, N-terminal domain-containing protein [Puniceicoccaceae bacterium K14]|nr:8-oxoguanine DNA glycosylase, N-terminal domain-containing protein [Puniceicoccaceae bacterium K14]